MQTKIHSNSQNFQSIYLDPKAEQWQDRIVFHEPIFEDEIPGVIALKSLDLEDLVGVVIAAPTNILRHYREKVKDLDIQEEWGKLDPATIIAKLVLTAKDLGAVVVYEQLGQEVTTQRDPEETVTPVTETPATEAPPSIPTVEDVEYLHTERQARGDTLPTPLPLPGAYPAKITPEGKKIWDQVIKDHLDKIKLYSDPSEQWQFAEYLYDLFCSLKGVSGYELTPSDRPSAVLKKLKSCGAEARDLIEAVIMVSSKMLRHGPKQPEIKDIRKTGEEYVMTVRRPWRKEGLFSIENFVTLLGKELNFIALDSQRCFKNVNPNTQICFTPSKANPNVFDLYTVYRIPVQDAQTLARSQDPKKILNRLRKILYQWIKTKRLSG